MNRLRLGNMLMIALVMVIFVAAMSFLIYQKVNLYNEVNGVIAQEKEAQVQDEALLGQLGKLKEQEAFLKSYAAVCESLIPNTPEENKLIDYLQSIAVDVSVEFVQIKFDTRVSGNSYMEMPLTITFDSSYPGFIAFIDRIKTGSRAIRIDGINAGLSGKGDLNIRVELTVKAFYKN